MEIEQEVLDCMEDLIKKVEIKEYKRKHYLKNKEKIREKQKEYRLKNTEKEKLRHKEYRLNNQEKIKEYQKEYNKKYNQTESRIKSCRISCWKKRKVISDDWDALYDHYLKTTLCDNCNIELTYDKYNTPTTKCLDHDHSITDAPNFRNILCHSCNVRRG